MKKILFLCCALLGFGAMASATDPIVDDNGCIDLTKDASSGRTEIFSPAVLTVSDAVITCTGEYYAEKQSWETSDEYYKSDDGSSFTQANNETDYGLTGKIYIKHTGADDSVGWWWDKGYDFVTSGYNKVVAVVESNDEVKFIAQGIGSSFLYVSSEDGALSIDLTSFADNEFLQQIYLQNTVAGQVITVKSIQFLYEEPIPVSGDVDFLTTYSSTDSWDNTSTDKMELKEDGWELTFTVGDWKGLCWTNWGSTWNLSDYDKVILEYEISGKADGNDLIIILQDATSNGMAKSVSYENDNSGKIEMIIADHALEADFSNIAAAIIQNNVTPLTVKVTAFYATKDSGSGDSFSPYTYTPASTVGIYGSDNDGNGIEGDNYTALVSSTDLEMTNVAGADAALVTITGTETLNQWSTLMLTTVLEDDDAPVKYSAISDGYPFDAYATVSVVFEFGETLTENSEFTLYGQFSGFGADYVVATLVDVIFFNTADGVPTRPNAIKEVKSSADAIEVARYNLAGQKISGEQKGINIVVYSDSSSKKVLVK